LAVGILLIFDNHLFTYLACTHRRHVCKKIQKSWGATKHTEGFGCYEKAILKKNKTTEVLFIRESQVILWFIKTDFKHIYCSYSSSH